MYNIETIKFAQKSEKEIKKFNYREHGQTKDDREKGRDSYRRDHGRVLYSSSFRRLQGKMQLLGIDNTHFYRNRLTHSLEVSQIAGGIARNLELKNPIVSEICSLVHDIGNPPFGHAGEKILNDLADDIGGYEGNAQTFRILRQLEKKHPEYIGLNLTIRTLFGVTKYFQKRKVNPYQNNKKFLYDDDYDFLEKQIQEKGIKIRKSIDAQIMDLADEIAYAAHDLEDALKSGLLTVQELMYEFSISDYKEAKETFDELASGARDLALTSYRLGTSEEYSLILRKELTSNIVYTLMRDIGVVKETLAYKKLGNLSLGLKKLVFKTISRKKDVFIYEKQGERVINGLFEVYNDKKFNNNLSLLPPELRIPENQLSELIRKRAVIDYIAGMMDSFALKEYSNYFGASSLDKIYDPK